MTQALHRRTAQELASLLRAKECSVRDVVEECLARIAALDPVVRAFVDVDTDAARRRASELDATGPTGPLHGIPIAIKETIDVAGLECPLGTPIHTARVPSRDAATVQRLRQAGAVIIGTTVSTEYAIARAGPTTNPHSRAHTPGGSSSGAAAAVAAGMVPLAIGTQTVGSIIRPATYCGVFGLKPTRGAVSTDGVMPLSQYLDHVGPLARTADDVALACESLLESTALPTASLSSSAMPVRALRIEGPMQARIEQPSREALDRAHALLEQHGVPVEARTLPSSFDDVVSCWETILLRDLAANHGADFDAFGDAMSDRLRQFITAGRVISNDDYDRAIARAQGYAQTLEQLLPRDVIILAPATDGTAPVFSEETGPSRLQGLWTLVGFPALAVPCGKVGALPVGVQLIAAPARDQLVLRAGGLFTAPWPG